MRCSQPCSRDRRSVWPAPWLPEPSWALISIPPLAFTAGLGLLAFAKYYGFIFLGRARDAASRLGEVGSSLSIAMLGVIILFLGAVAPWEIHALGSGLQSLLGVNAANAVISHPLVLGPVFANFSVLAPTWLMIVPPAFSLVAGLVVMATRSPGTRPRPGLGNRQRRPTRGRPVPTVGLL